MSEENQLPRGPGNPICFRLSPDLKLAVEQLAFMAGVSTTEWIKNLIYQAVYQQLPDVSDGYLQGRSIAYTVASALIANAMQQMPKTYEEGAAMLAAIAASMDPNGAR